MLKQQTYQEIKEIKLYKEFIIETKRKNIKTNVLKNKEYIEYQIKKNKDLKSILQIFELKEKMKENIFILDIKKEEALFFKGYFNNNYLPYNTFFKKYKKILFKKLQEQIKTKKNFYFDFYWINPKTNKPEINYTFISKIPNQNLIIGEGFYKSNLNYKLNKIQNNKFNILLDFKLNKILIILIVILFLSFVLSFYISFKLKNYFKNYQLKILKHEKELEDFNKKLEKKVLERTKELEEMKNELEKIAKIDILTNTNNRYSLIENFKKEIERAKRYNTDLSIIMYDIDFFKKINDNYGHDIGDNILIELSKIIKNSIRKTDILSRYGGEEFIILLPHTNINHATIVAENLRKKVEKTKFPNIQSLTISVGVTELNKTKNETEEELFKRVDKLLYKSKREGRNKVSA